jgi:cytochrome c
MTRVYRIAMTCLFLLAAVGARASTPDEARALVDQAIAEIKAKGLDAAANEITAGGKWRRGSLYVVLVKFDGSVVAHSAYPKFVGRNMLELKDANGKMFVKEAVEAHRTKDAAVAELRWANPETKQVSDATAYSRRVPGLEMYVNSIVFK